MEKTLPQENIEEVSSGENIPKLYPLDGEGNTISTFTGEKQTYWSVGANAQRLYQVV